MIKGRGEEKTVVLEGEMKRRCNRNFTTPTKGLSSDQEGLEKKNKISLIL